jgi:hypothetical protein
MSQHHPGVDHAIIDHDFNGARVRIVPIEDLEGTIADLRVLFPHDLVLFTTMGCRHVCVYTHNASAAVVAEHLRIHLIDVEHRAA